MFYHVEKSSRSQSLSMSSMHTHNYYELYFLLEGERDFFVNNSIFKISSFSFLYIPPFVTHKTMDDKFVRICIYYSSDYFSHEENVIFDKLLSNRAININENQKNMISDILNKLIELQNEKSQESVVFTKTLTSALLYLLCQKEHSNCQIKQMTESKQTPQLINKLTNYIEANLNKKISIKTICDEFFISYSYLCKLFRKNLFTSVNEFIETSRITKACDLLCRTKKNIEKISEECGFSSAKYFCMIFKKNIGLSPTNYRKFQKEK